MGQQGLNSLSRNTVLMARCWGEHHPNECQTRTTTLTRHTGTKNHVAPKTHHPLLEPSLVPRGLTKGKMWKPSVHSVPHPNDRNHGQEQARVAKAQNLWGIHMPHTASGTLTRVCEMPLTVRRDRRSTHLHRERAGTRA